MARKAKSRIKFEEGLQAVEEIVERLESGELILDESLAKYEQAVKAIKECYKILEDAEKRIEILVKGEDGELKAQPFTSSDAQSGERQVEE